MDLDELKFFFGLEVLRSYNGIYIYHGKYALDIFADTGFLAAKLVLTPMMQDKRSFFDKSSTPYDIVS